MSVASAHRASLERRPVRRRGKSGLPAPVLTMTPSPWVIRRPARNRVGNQLTRAPGANPGRARSPRLQTRFTLFALTPRTGRRPPARPGAAAPSATCRRCGGPSDCSRRDTRQWVKRLGSGPIGDGTDSPLPHPAPRCPHDCSRLRGSGSAVAVVVSACADEPFFRGVEPERGRHTVGAWPTCDRSQRYYGHVESALKPAPYGELNGAGTNGEAQQDHEPAPSGCDH
jgi:hypothetical protein